MHGQRLTPCNVVAQRASVPLLLIPSEENKSVTRFADPALAADHIALKQLTPKDTDASTIARQAVNQ